MLKSQLKPHPTFIKFKFIKKKNWHQILQKRAIFFPKQTKFKLNVLKNYKKFNFGNSKFFNPQTFYLTPLFVTRFILNLKRIVRKKDKTLRKYWINSRVLFKLSKQSKGARMGKGKGKNLTQFQKYSAFTNFIEFSGVRFGRLLFFIRYFNSRFPTHFYLIRHWSTNFTKYQSFLFRNA